MSGPSFHIMFEFRPGPYGGANQFLKALRDALARAGAYTDDPAMADVVLFNSHHRLADVFRARRAFPGKIFIHRVDGPMSLYNDPADKRDGKVIAANRLMADATVFQSRWSRDENRRLGWLPSGPESIIGNAPDPALFNRVRPFSPLSRGKVRLIATSWSDNQNKGFDVYRYLDAAL
ncbi:MAG TPA: glycosyltransferase family 1 protein, partial [Rhodospirillales bacterium]|nr:glycosyltransferase family 1 protein [Rhodospirillales bacterium]